MKQVKRPTSRCKLFGLLEKPQETCNKYRQAKAIATNNSKEFYINSSNNKGACCPNTSFMYSKTKWLGKLLRIDLLLPC